MPNILLTSIQTLSILPVRSMKQMKETGFSSSTDLFIKHLSSLNIYARKMFFAKDFFAKTANNQNVVNIKIIQLLLKLSSPNLAMSS